MLAEFGRNIRIARIKRDLSQQALAQLVGASTACIGHMERGAHNTGLATALGALRALDMDRRLMACITLPDEPVEQSPASLRALGRKLRQVREGQGLPRAILALRMGVAAETLRRLETGAKGSLVNAMAATLDLGLGSIFCLASAPEHDDMGNRLVEARRKRAGGPRV